MKTELRLILIAARDSYEHALANPDSEQDRLFYLEQLQLIQRLLDILHAAGHRPIL